MSTIGVRDYLNALRHRHQEVEQELGQVRMLAQKHFQRSQELGQRRDEALKELGAALLPAFTPEALERARQITGCHPVGPELIGD
ncbi:MAG: hypothetical protein AB1758_34190, partial [Candidatus Eremiobacterota bacterium]